MKTLLLKRWFAVAFPIAALALATTPTLADLEVDPCRPVIVVEPVEGLVAANTVLYAQGDSSDDGGLHETASVLESEIATSGGSWSAFAPLRGSTSTVEPRAEFTITWLNAHAVIISIYTRSTGETTEATISGKGQAGAEIPIRLMAGQSSATSGTVRVQRARHVVGLSGSTGTGKVDGIERDIRDEEYRTSDVTDYVVNVGDYLPAISLTSDVDVAGAGDLVAEVTLTIEVQPGDPCCNDPCCGDPCCGDPCCSDPCSFCPRCCGDNTPCCESPDPCCDINDECCGNPDRCCNDDNLLPQLRSLLQHQRPLLQRSESLLQPGQSVLRESRSMLQSAGSVLQ